MVDSIQIEVPSDPSIVEIAIESPIVQIEVPAEVSQVEVGVLPDPTSITITEYVDPVIVEIFDPYHTSNLVPHRYKHIQSTPARAWVITHNLNTEPLLNIVVNGTVTGCRVTYPSLDSALIEFNNDVSGTAYAIG